MVKNELLFLGLLMSGPKHGYEIKRQLKEDLFLFFELSVKSIYYPLSRMKKEGLVERKTVKEGKRPRKYLYSITDKGKQRFKCLLRESFLEVERPFFSIDLSLYFLSFVERKTLDRRLKARIFVLKKFKKGLLSIKEKRGSDFPIQLELVVVHNIDLIKSEIKSLQRVREILSSSKQSFQKTS